MKDPEPVDFENRQYELEIFEMHNLIQLKKKQSEMHFDHQDIHY